jgi:hypothetical protein
MCGTEMTSEGYWMSGGWVFYCPKCRSKLFVAVAEGCDEKAARLVWKAGLMGQLRQEYKRYIDKTELYSVPYLLDIVRKLFGGGDERA